MKCRILHIEAEGEGVPTVLRTAFELTGSGGSTFEIRDLKSPSASSAPSAVRSRIETGSGGHLLDHAPTSPAELPAWFDSLPDDQLDSVWVAAIIERAAEDDGKVSVPNLAAALNTVRSRYRAASLTGAHGATGGSPAGERPPKPRAPSGLSTAGSSGRTLALVALALEALPAVGDEREVREIIPAQQDRSLLYQRVHRGLEPRLQWITAPSRNHPARIRRIA